MADWMRPEALRGGGQASQATETAGIGLFQPASVWLEFQLGDQVQ